jgi:hypothetical protein
MNMTEAEWLACTEPTKIIVYLRRKRVAGARRLRLFACACCRRLWPWLEEPCRRAVATAERQADGQATRQELADAHAAARRANRGRFDKRGWLYGRGAEGPHGRVVAKWAWEAAEGAARPTGAVVGKVVFAAPLCAAAGGNETAADAVALTALLRDLFGNPFRPVACDPAWRTPTVRRLAEVIYEEGAFDRLPILADALEEAGCDNADILSHLRGPGPHVRGCWLLDLLLNKE